MSYEEWRAELLRDHGLGWHPHAAPAAPPPPRAAAEQGDGSARDGFRQAERALQSVRAQVRQLQREQLSRPARLEPEPEPEPRPRQPEPPQRQQLPQRHGPIPASSPRRRLHAVLATEPAAGPRVGLDDELLAAAAAQLEDVRRQLLPSPRSLRASTQRRLRQSPLPAAAAEPPPFTPPRTTVAAVAPEQEGDASREADARRSMWDRATQRTIRQTFSKQNGLSKRQLRKLRCVQPSSLSAAARAASCAVCLCAIVCEDDDGGDDGAGVVVLRCAHVFHRECIRRWLTRSSICPVCRAPAVRRKKRRDRANDG